MTVKSLPVESKLNWAEDLRVLALIGVIILHVTPNMVYYKETVSSFVWWSANIFTSTFRYCVPIFVMLTGALILPRSYELKDFIKKRFFRIIPPFVFWSLIYILFNFSISIYNGEVLTVFQTINSIFQQLKYGSSFHLWYVYMIIGMYLIIPIIGTWVRNCSEREIIYFLLIWFITLLLNQPLIIKLKPNVDLTFFTGFIGYLVLGYYLSIKTFKNGQLIKTVSILLIITGIFITLIGTYYLTNLKGRFYERLYDYLSPNVLFVSIGLFLFFKNLKYENKHLFKVRNFISRNSYGIYLVHVIVLYFLSTIGLNWKFINPFLGIPVTVVFCLFLSGLIIYLLSKLPYGKYIAG